MRFGLFITTLFATLLLHAQTRFLKHHVKSGETIYTIATKYGADAKYLLMLNNLPDNVKLGSGDVVLIRELKPGEEPATEVKEFVEKSTYQPTKTTAATSEATTGNAEEIKTTKAVAKSTTTTATKIAVEKTTAPSTINYNGTGYEVSNSGVHVVEKGQTFYRISVIYGISVDKLKEMNGLSNTNISVGQKLKVPTR